MAYDPYTKDDLTTLHNDLADMADAVRKIISAMGKAESVDLQLRELRKLVRVHKESTLQHLDAAKKKIEKASEKGEKLKPVTRK